MSTFDPSKENSCDEKRSAVSVSKDVEFRLPSGLPDWTYSESNPNSKIWSLEGKSASVRQISRKKAGRGFCARPVSPLNDQKVPVFARSGLATPPLPLSKFPRSHVPNRLIA